MEEMAAVGNEVGQGKKGADHGHEAPARSYCVVAVGWVVAGDGGSGGPVSLGEERHGEEAHVRG